MHWLVLGALASPIPALAMPPPVGSGPLLFLQHPSAPPRTEQLFVVDPTSDRGPRLVWTGSNPRPTPLHRASQHEVLLEHEGRLWMLDLRTGDWQAVSAEGQQATFLGAIGGALVYFEGTAIDRWGYRLERHVDGHLTIGEVPRRTGRLLRLDTVTRQVEPWNDVPIEAVLARDGDGAWAVTAGSDRALLRVGPHGTVRRVLDFDARWVAPEAHLAPSPDGRRIALVVVHDQHAFHTERDIVIFDPTGTAPPVVRRRVSIETFGDGGDHLRPSWRSDEVLGVGLAFFDATTGHDLAAADVPPLASPPPDPEVRGRFALSHGRAFLDGRVVADVLDGDGVQVRDLVMSPDEGWVAWVSPTQTLLVGDGGDQKLLIEGWSYDLVWVDAAALAR